MKSSRISKSKCLRTPENVSMLDLLHSGGKRAISKKQYVKIFAKIRIDSKSKPNSAMALEEIERMRTDNQTFRQRIADAEAINSDLRARINKQRKIEGILAKKMENVDATELSFNNAFEIKLLFQAETLEQRLREREIELEKITKQQKYKQANSQLDANKPLTQFFTILLDKSKQIDAVRQSRELVLHKGHEHIVKLRQKMCKMKEIKKTAILDLKQIDSTIEKAKERVPNLNSKSTEANSSGMLATNFQRMSANSLEKEIQMLEQASKEYERRIHELMEEKVREKLAVLKVMHSLQIQNSNEAPSKNGNEFKKLQKKQLVW